jgi:hypothetical protein
MDLIGIFSQTAGSTCKFWVNPVNFTFCLQVNFPEVWHELYAMGAQIVFWVCALSVSVVYLNQAFLCVCKCAMVECLIGV